MIRNEQQIKVVTFSSSIHPNIQTDNMAMASVIEWADAHPVVWKIVMGSRSAPFGKNSSTYMGYQRGDSFGCALERTGAFKREYERVDDFWGWRAQFTLAHFGDTGFKGGFFQQYDGSYGRGCCHLDYTPKTLDEVVERFLKWCNTGSCRYETREVRLDKKTIRKFSER